jgi:hypothetical protein
LPLQRAMAKHAGCVRSVSRLVLAGLTVFVVMTGAGACARTVIHEQSSGTGSGTGGSVGTGGGGGSSVLPSGQCRNDADCVASCPSEFCNYPYPPGYPGCDPAGGFCGTDADCTGADICVDGCCGNGCTTNADCGPGATCSPPDCNPNACAKDSDCPVNFVCNKTCSRKPCSTDAECHGYCVSGECWEQPGVCAAPIG